MKRNLNQKRKSKSGKQLRDWEHLSDRRCLICKKPFVAIEYWAYGGKNILGDHWIISSVYCSTNCSRIGHKLFMASESKSTRRRKSK
jgi:hypothetical protein